MGAWANRFGLTANPLEIFPALGSALESGGGGSGDSDIYNWGASNTRRLASSLAKAVAGTGYSDHVVLGDGQTAGYIGGISRADVWPTKLMDRLVSLGVPAGGTGWVMPLTAYLANLDPRFSVSGTISTTPGAATWIARPRYLETSTSGATVTFVSDRPGTSASVAYYKSSAAFTVTVDGGSPVTVTPSGDPTAAMGIYTATSLSETTHTIVVTTTTTSPTLIVAMSVDNGAGIRIHNLAADGAPTSYYTGSAMPTVGWTVENLVTDPDVVHLPLGFNDNFVAVPVSTTIANLSTIRAKWPNADVILYAPPEASTAANWGTYVDALYTLAETFDCPLVDIYKATEGYTVANANGLMTNQGGGTDRYYPSVAGHARWATVASSRFTLPDYTLDTARRTFTTLTTTATLPAIPGREYWYRLGSGAVPTLPSAAGNTSVYHLKNVHTAPIPVAPAAGQTIDGGASMTLLPDEAITIVSNGTTGFEIF